MKHIAPQSVTVAPPRTKYLHDALTGHVITSRTVGLSDPFDGSWITEAVASYFEVSPDQVGSVDTDERLDNLTIDGEIVGYVECN